MSASGCSSVVAAFQATYSGAVDFYYSRTSGNSARSAFALFESGIPFVPHFVDPRQSQNRTTAYLALNPTGKVPALIDHDDQGQEIRLWESNAINWYVAEKHPEARLLPSSAAARAGVQKWLFFQASHVSPACIAIFRHTHQRVRAFWGIKGDAAGAETGTQELGRFLPVLEEALQGREWLEGTFSLADIAFLPHLEFIAAGGFDFGATPAVRAWLDRMRARPAWQRTVELVHAD
jgi:glutathione S-transferase